MVLTTHYMEEAERLADTVVVIDAGRVVATGSPAELTRGGAEGQLRFRATPGLDVPALAAALPAGCAVSEPQPGQYLVEGPVDPQLLAAVTAWCAGARGAGRGPAGAAAVAGGRLPRPDRPGAAVSLTSDDGRRARAERPGPTGGEDAMTFTPAPGAAPTGRMLAAQTGMELRLSLRNGEQVLLTLLIPLLLTGLLVAEPFLGDLPGRRVDFVVPGVLALAVTSAAFTGLAIATGFERKYGVLKRLGATALPRPVLLLGKTGAVLVRRAAAGAAGRRAGAGAGLAADRRRDGGRCPRWRWWWSARPRSPGSGC